MKCSIVIRCCNEEHHIERLLQGILLQTESDVEIIAVDSGSTDSTLDILSRYPVRVLSIAPDEFSFGRSLNIGCRNANGEFLLIISAHTYPVYKNWINELISPFNDERIAMVYGKQRGDINSNYAEHQIFKRWFPDKSCMNQRHPFCNNANAAIRKETWEKNIYDETLTGLEDLDLAKRLMQQGFRIAYNASAEVIHIHNESWQRVRLRYQREAVAHRDIFPQQKFSFMDFLYYLSVNITNDLGAAFKDKTLKEHFIDIIFFRLMQFWGTFQGFNKRSPTSDALRHCFFYPEKSCQNDTSETQRSSNMKLDYSKSVKQISVNE